VTIVDGPYENMREALRKGRADALVGALRDDPPGDVVQEHLFDDALAIIVRRGHPLVAACAGHAPSREALTRYPWIAPRRGSPLRGHFEQLLDRAMGSPPAAPIECNSLATARALLRDSDRVMLLSAHQVREDLRTGGLVALPHPAGRVVRAIGLTVRHDWRPTAAQAALLQSIRSVAYRLERQGRPSSSKPPRTWKARGETPMRRVKKGVK
jgi:DNA-binding transcriptional LysR family regulator